MPGKKRLLVPANQLSLIDIKPEPSKPKKPRVPKRTDILEQRVTHLEAEVTLITAQLEREDGDE